MEEFATQAVILIASFGAMSASVTQIIKAILRRAGKPLPEGASAIIAGVMSCALTAASLYSMGAQWQVALIATVVAYHAPQLIYNGMAVGHMAATNGGH